MDVGRIFLKRGGDSVFFHGFKNREISFYPLDTKKKTVFATNLIGKYQISKFRGALAYCPIPSDAYGPDFFIVLNSAFYNRPSREVESRARFFYPIERFPAHWSGGIPARNEKQYRAEDKKLGLNTQSLLQISSGHYWSWDKYIMSGNHCKIGALWLYRWRVRGYSKFTKVWAPNTSKDFKKN